MNSGITTTADPCRLTMRFGDAEADIEIAIRDGKPFCVPYRAYVRRNQAIKWHFDGQWTIRFLDKRTPFPGVFNIWGKGNDVYYRHEDGKQVSPPVVVGHPGERFRYAVAAADTSGVYLEVACPEIIIDFI